MKGNSTLFKYSFTSRSLGGGSSSEKSVTNAKMLPFLKFKYITHQLGLLCRSTKFFIWIPEVKYSAHPLITEVTSSFIHLLNNCLLEFFDFNYSHLRISHFHHCIDLNFPSSIQSFNFQIIIRRK